MDKNEKDILKTSESDFCGKERDFDDEHCASQSENRAEVRKESASADFDGVLEEKSATVEKSAASGGETAKAESSSADGETAKSEPSSADGEIDETGNAGIPAELSFDESPIVVTDAPVKKKKFLKPWAELTKNEKINRVLAIVMAIALVAIVTFTTVWCCIIADKAYNTPQWKTEREVYRNNVEKTLEDLGSGLKVAEEKFGENPRWFIAAKEPFDMRYQLYPENANVAGYRYMFLETFRETSDSTVVTWNVNGYVENFNGVSDGKPVLSDGDGAVVELSFWGFEAREKTFSRSGENGILYADYKISAVVDGKFYTISAECQSPDGTFDEKLLDRIKLYAKNVMTHLSDINR